MKLPLSLIITMRYVAVRNCRKPGFRDHRDESPNRPGEDRSERDRQPPRPPNEAQSANAATPRSRSSLLCFQVTKHSALLRRVVRITVVQALHSNQLRILRELDES